jgi:4-hydroxy-2-oxoheptanedioate aldolase
MGVKHFCIGWDVGILHDWWKANGEGMRAIMSGASPAAAGPASGKPY